MDFVVVKNIAQGIERTKEFLYEEVDRKTVLFLSGGKTPKALYETLAKEQVLTPAAVGMLDERYSSIHTRCETDLHIGCVLPENSNELMIRESGFLRYLEKHNIPFYSVLSPVILSEAKDLDSSAKPQNDNVDQVARDYDQTVRDLFFKFPRSIAVVGIGDDGHIASIFPSRKDFKNPLFAKSNTYEYVVGVDDPKKYGKRITLTFAGLSLIDFYLVFVFGKEKKKALKKALSPGQLEEIPARFFQKQEISEKTLIITDQKL